jgi:hypothetical protein
MQIQVFTTSTGEHLDISKEVPSSSGSSSALLDLLHPEKIDYYLRNIQFTHNFSEAHFSIILLFMGSPSTMTIRASIQ